MIHINDDKALEMFDRWAKEKVLCVFLCPREMGLVEKGFLAGVSAGAAFAEGYLDAKGFCESKTINFALEVLEALESCSELDRIPAPMSLGDDEVRTMSHLVQILRRSLRLFLAKRCP